MRPRTSAVDLLLACTSLTGASAGVAHSVPALDATWAPRARELLRAAGEVRHEVEGLRFASGLTRQRRCAGVAKHAEEIVGLAMRMHNMLPAGHRARALAFDAAMHASLLREHVNPGEDADEG